MALETRKVRSLKKMRSGWVAYVSGEVQPRKFSPEYSEEDVLFELELAGFNIDRVRKHARGRRS